MNKQLAIFLVAAALLVGSFLGSYLRKGERVTNGSILSAAKALIDNSAGDQIKLAQASDLLTLEIAQEPGNLLALFLQARALQQRGLIDQALKSYRQYFAQKVSTDFAANYNAGELSELKGDFPSAEGFFSECVKVAPKEESGWERLILVLLRQQRNADAKEQFKALIRLLPNSEAVKRLSLKMP